MFYDKMLGFLEFDPTSSVLKELGKLFLVGLRKLRILLSPACIGGGSLVLGFLWENFLLSRVVMKPELLQFYS